MLSKKIIPTLVFITALSLLLLTVPAMAATPEENAETITAISDSLTYVWLLLTGGLVFWMQAGFALLEAGFTRTKNTSNILMKNLMDFCFGAISYWAVGWGFMMASGSLFIGTDFSLENFFITLDNLDGAGTYNLWFFEMVFAATAATIVSGAMAERTKFKAYILYSIAITALIYPIYAHWVWSGYGLFWDTSGPDGSSLSFIESLFGVPGHDFAGSGVVHGVGGYAALAGALILGPRLGKYKDDGTPNVIPGHNITMAMLGGFILTLGWLGFNGGSTLSATDVNISAVVVNTFLAAAAGGITAMILTWAITKKPDPGMSINGLIAGLVAITAPCGSVYPWAAIVIGIIGAIVMFAGVRFNETVLKVDDPVGAIAVHGYTGTWGVIAVGIFSNGIVFANGGYGAAAGLLYGGTAQFGVNLVMAIFNAVWAFGASFIIFKIIDAVIGLRVSPEEETMGLDIGEHGMRAYPEYIME